MATDVYDPEQKKDTPDRRSDGSGSHDDLGVHPERREAEAAELEDLYNAEAAPEPEARATRADTQEGEQAAPKTAPKGEDDNDGGNASWKTKLKHRSTRVNNTRKVLAFLGVSSFIVAGIVALITFLLPFKLTHIIEQIEQRVGNVPQYAVEQRLEFYMSRYLMIRALDSTGHFDFSVGGADRDRFTYLGPSFWATMYVNWRGANIESKMANEYGVKLRALNNNPEFYRGGRLRATDFELEHLGTGRNSSLHRQRLDRGEARQFIKLFSKSETKSREVFKRWNMRRIEYKYYGIGRWKPFEKTRDAIANKYRQKKLAFKKFLIDQSVGRISARYDKYFKCLLESTGKSCRDLLKRADQNVRAPGANDQESDGRREAKERLDADTPQAPDSNADKRIGRELTERLQKIGLKKALTALASGIGIVHTLSHVYDSVEGGTVNQVIYDKNAQQYVAWGAPFLSAADQIQAGNNKSIARSGDFDIEDVRIAHEIFSGYNTSPVYETGVTTTSGVIHRDCNNDPDDGNETTLDQGEVVCHNKKLLVDRTTFTDSAAWNALGTVLAPYRNTVGGVIDDLANALGDVVEAIGLADVSADIMEFFGIDAVTGRAFELVINWISGPVITGLEIGADAFDALYASVAVVQSSVGGDAGVAKEDTIGGAYLTGIQAGAIRQQQMDDYYHELQEKPFFARYFSPEIKESLTGQLALNMPTDAQSWGQQMASVFSKPLNIVGSVFGTVSRTPKVAALGADTNPFDALYMGFPNNHPIFTENEGQGMDPDDVSTRYNCDQPVNERPQNVGDGAFGRGPDDLPFDVPLIPDPCLLEVAVEEASTKYFTGEMGASDFGPLEAGTPTAPTGPVGPPGTCPNPIGENRDPTVSGLNAALLIQTVGGIRVHRCIASQVQQLLTAAAADGVHLGGGGWRDPQQQIALRRAHCGSSEYAIYHMPASLCRPPTAPPGKSLHEYGLAIDFDTVPPSSGRCSTRSTRCFQWLNANAAQFGFRNLPSEPWHWSVTGN